MTDHSDLGERQQAAQFESPPAPLNDAEKAQAAAPKFSLFAEKPAITADGSVEDVPPLQPGLEATTPAVTVDDSKLTPEQKNANLMKESHFKHFVDKYNLTPEQMDSVRNKFADVNDPKDIGQILDFQERLDLIFALKDEYAGDMVSWEQWAYSAPIEDVIRRVYGDVKVPVAHNIILDPDDGQDVAPQVAATPETPAVAAAVETPESAVSAEDEQKLKTVTQLRQAVQRGQAFKQFVQSDLAKDSLTQLGLSQEEILNLNEDALQTMDPETFAQFEQFFDENVKDDNSTEELREFNKQNDKTLLQLLKARGVDYVALSWEDTDGPTILRTIFLQNASQTTGRESFGPRPEDTGKGLDVMGFKDILKWEMDRGNPDKNKDNWMDICKLMYKKMGEQVDVSKWDDVEMTDSKRRELLQEFYEKCLEVANDPSRGKKSLNKALMEAVKDPDRKTEFKNDSIAEIDKFHFTAELMANMQMLAYSPDHFKRFFS